MSFGGLVLTDAGRLEIARAEMGEQFSITEIVLGEGMCVGAFSGIEEVVAPVMRIPLSKITRNNDEVYLEFEFGTNTAPRAFYYREIGIIVNGKLCYYDNCGDDAEYIDPNSTNLIKQKRVKVVLLISSGVNINVSIPSTLYAMEYDLLLHTDNKNNPHAVTKDQVGLGAVDNTADVNKPVSSAQQAAINAAYANSNYYTDEKIAELINGAPSTMDTLKEIADAMAENDDVVTALEEAIGKKATAAEVDSHIADMTNPHAVTKEQVGLGNVPNVSTNNQTPTYTEASTLTELASGEKLSVAFGKIKLAVKNVINIVRLLGNTDISSIGDGTITGILNQINSNLIDLNALKIRRGIATTDASGNIYIDPNIFGSFSILIAAGTDTAGTILQPFTNVYGMKYVKITKTDGTPYTGTFALFILIL